MVKSKRTSKLVAWIPALVVIGATVITASGLSLIPGATASSVAVNGSVAGGVATDAAPTGGGGANGCADETLAAFASAYAVTNGCQVTFATNGASGAEIVYSDTNASATRFFCSDGITGAGGARDCTADNWALDNVAANNSAVNVADTIGLALVGVGGDGGIGAGTANTLDATPTDAEAIWSPINNVTRQLCKTTGPNAAATCNFVVGGQGEGATQAAGDYTGSVTLTTLTL